jgi:hypothetical protein
MLRATAGAEGEGVLGGVAGVVVDADQRGVDAGTGVQKAVSWFWLA